MTEVRFYFTNDINMLEEHTPVIYSAQILADPIEDVLVVARA